MAPTTKPQPSSTKEASTAQQAGDLLWKFQLRKEHDELIAKLNVHQQQLSTFVSDTKLASEKLHARLNVVEKKIEKLDAEDKKLVQETGKIREDLRVLTDKVGIVVEKGIGKKGANKEVQNGADQSAVLPRGSKDAGRTRKGPQAPTGRNQATAKETSVVPRRELRSSVQPTEVVNAGRGQLPPSSGSVLPVLSSIESNRTAIAGKNITPPSLDIVPHASSDDTDDLDAPPKLPNRTVAKPRPAQIDSVDSQPPELPRQGTSTLKDYFTAADSYFAVVLRSNSPRAESEFVKRFLDGLTNENHRRTLIGSLQTPGLMSMTTSQSGARNIVVRWTDLKEAVKRSKLLEATNVTKPGTVLKEVKQGISGNRNGQGSAKITKAQRPRPKRFLIMPEDLDDLEELLHREGESGRAVGKGGHPE